MRVPERPRQRPDLIFREIDGDFVVYDPVSDLTLLINVASAAVLELCDGRRTAGDIAGQVAAAFGVEAAEVRAEVDASLEIFARRGFFEIV